MRPKSGFRFCSKLSINWKNHNDVTTCWNDVIATFFDVVLFLLVSLVTYPSFMTISLLVLELWRLSFMRYFPEIRKSEIFPDRFCPISGDWDELGIPNLQQLSLMKCYWMLQKTRVKQMLDNKLPGALSTKNKKKGKTISASIEFCCALKNVFWKCCLK